ncbi:MAG: hypothetical protein KGV58_01210 [Campylobacteraceae bacterium]|nr:hypothetical protein [Campylobacteraceae bacterium]
MRIKIAFAICVFFGSFLYLFFNLISPSLQAREFLKKESKKQKIITKATTNTAKKDIKNLHVSVKKINKEPINNLKNSFDRVDFIGKVNQYFSDVNISNMQKYIIDDKLYFYEFKLKATMQNPDDFYNFLSSLDGFKNVIKISYPISIETKGDALEANFELQVYQEN